MMRLPPLSAILRKLFLTSSIPLYLVVLSFILAVFIAAAFVIWIFLPNAFLPLFVGGSAGLLLCNALFIYRRLFHEGQNHYRQAEALFSLHALISIRHPLPPMREWAISPDLANVIVALIQERKPKTIVEASSGISTLISGYCLETGEGKVISLEADARFASITARNVARHGLSDVANVVHAPLKTYSINGESWQWYDISALTSVDKIDMLIVDGPIVRVQKLARYPALPLLINQLSDQAVIVLDDGIRKSEQEIVRRWLQEFTDFEAETLPTEKITFVLTRRA